MAVCYEDQTDGAAALVASRFLMLLWKSVAGERRGLFSLEGAGRGETNRSSGTEFSIKADLSRETAAEIPTADKLASLW